MTNQYNITPELLHQLLRYEPDTGKLFWKSREPHNFTDGEKTKEHQCAAWNARYANNETFNQPQNKGYLCGDVMKIRLLTHRTVWAVAYGSWPRCFIDHIDGDRKNNRLNNLRLADATSNMRNFASSRRNQSGIVGVHFDNKAQKWVAQIVIDKKHHWLGQFVNFDDAVACRKASEAVHGVTIRQLNHCKSPASP